MLHKRLWIIGVIMVLYSAWVMGQTAPGSVTPTQVYNQVQQLSAELRQICEALGKPEASTAGITVKNASPREVYFQAETLFAKANDLAFEVMGRYQNVPKEEVNQLTPKEVMVLVEASLKVVRMVKYQLHITKEVNIPPVKEEKTLSDVFNAILKANEQLNNLTYTNTEPRHVFQQVTLAINYMDNLLRQAGVSDRLPKEESVETYKKPSDVYQRLMQCISILQQIAKQSNVKMLSLDSRENKEKLIRPSDVLDLSKIIVAEVRYLNSLLKNSQPVLSYMTHYKTPSQVYQRAGVLLEQLNRLEAAVSKNPNWLSQKRQ